MSDYTSIGFPAIFDDSVTFYKDISITGNLTGTTLGLSGNATIAGNLTGKTLGLSGNATISGNLTATTFSGNITGNINSSGVSTITTLQTNAITTVAGKPILNSSGSIIQTVYGRSDSRTTISSNPSGDGTTISALGLTITPTNASNRIICQWMINGEMHQDNVFLIHRDGTLITTSGEEGRNSISNDRWIGYASAFYDQNEDSTPSNWYILYSQIAGSTASRTYAPAVRSSSGGSYGLYLNRTVASGDGGQDAYERMVSTGIVYEVVV